MLSVNTSCVGAGFPISIEVTPVDIKGKSPADAKIYIFDGTTLKPLQVSNRGFLTVHGISAGYYGALFFTRQGFYPKTLVFKAEEEIVKIAKLSLNPLKDTSKGVLTGIVYKPVRGGKLREHTGILQTFKDERIDLIRDNLSYKVTTDDDGIFMLELLPGEYKVLFGNGDIGTVVIEKGKTTIKTIQRGMVLVD